MFSFLFICMGIGFGQTQSGKSVILPNAEVTYKYETSSNMKTRPPENTMTSSYHVLKRTIERYDDDDAGDGEINTSITKPTGNTEDFAVRLNSSYSSDQGRLEIYYSGRWGTVCNSGFTNVSARVACARLGFGYTGTVVSNLHGDVKGPIWLDGVNCNGTESGIEQCDHNEWGANNCSHKDDVSIRCACGINYFSAPTGTISSPNFPGEYAIGLDCHNYITLSPEETIIIKFLALYTEPGYDWVTITCESRNRSTCRSTSMSGSQLPPVLTLSSCNRISVHFRSDDIITKTGFSLTYNVTRDNVIRGITTKPSNAFPRVDEDYLTVFNCTTSSEYLPWWTFSRQGSYNYTITNSTCGVITSALFSSYYVKTETLGSGSCNLILTDSPKRLTGIVTCTDSTLSSARAILAPINFELRLATGMNSSAVVKDVVRDEEIRISCNASFYLTYSRSSLEFTGTFYSGGPVVLVRILRIFWTSDGNDISNTSSYVLAKAPKDGVLPPYTCKVVCDFYTNISDFSGDSSMELSFSIDPVNLAVLYWPTYDNMRITGDNNGQIRIPAVLNCSAAAYPPATYAWIDESSGNTINGPTITITHFGYYTCIASNIIRGRRYQQSKSITLQAVEATTTQNPTVILNPTVSILLGAGAIIIIIILVIIIIRLGLCRQLKRTTENGREYELPQRGEEGNIYEAGIDDIDKLDDIRRCLPAIPPIYDEIVDHDYGHELQQPGECIHHKSAKGNEIYFKPSEYEYHDASQRPLSTIYDELDFDK